MAEVCRLGREYHAIRHGTTLEISEFQDLRISGFRAISGFQYFRTYEFEIETIFTIRRIPKFLKCSKSSNPEILKS
jgi:hypothetical protein